MRKIQNVTLCKNEFLQRQTFLMNKSVILQYFLAKFSQKLCKKSVNKIISPALVAQCVKGLLPR
jgi:hypothetical protein